MHLNVITIINISKPKESSILYTFKSTNIVKRTQLLEQYRTIANSSLGRELPSVPKEGWVRTCPIRKALDMSGAQLAKRLGLSRNRVSVLERNEVEGEITLSQLKALAEQLNCDLTYALVPRMSVEQIIEHRAVEIATQDLNSNFQHMLLEAQSLDRGEAQARLLEQVKHSIIMSGGRVIWRKH